MKKVGPYFPIIIFFLLIGICFGCMTYSPIYRRVEVMSNGIHKIENPALSFKL
jgi:hypothetical protein